MTLLTTPRPAAVPRALPPAAARLRRVLPEERVPAALAAATVLLVCLPTGGDQDVTAAVHVTPADVASVALVCLCALRAAAGLRRGGPGPLPVRAAVLFSGVLLAVAAATAASQDPAQSLSGFVRMVQVFVLVPLAVMLCLRDRRDLRLLLAALVGAALVEGAVGVEQYLTGTGASYDGGTVRAVGTFGAQDVMAMSAVVSYGLIAALGLALDARAAGRRRAAALYGLAALALAPPLALSFSRGSWIATGCAVGVALLLTDVRLLLRGALYGLAAAVLLVGGLGLGGGSVLNRLGSIASVTGAPDHSVSDRYDLWATAAAIWRQHPATGVGPKEFPQFRDAHAPLRLSSGSDTAGAGAGFSREPLLSPHNMYLLVLSEQGLIGLTAFGALVLGLLSGAARAAWSRRTGLGAALLGLLVWQLVDFLYADIGGPTTVLVSFVLGLAAHGALRGPGADGGAAAP
ncbi:O-antigen ligase family protein [Streptacidiphilus sp. PB12-B1b]|uniref:O-antigen ligase family protein n=1 Tax=Streptacidiphilus sp. PB12-B1b TaxID=2705012 RepID=UPI0015FD5636|nr:O-antigen ligase family protein [Streptacidiphilus sp. PB12-B1b]QMU78531.1 O-antigen ligase family protein [Streptacidiphilus sp. PB12-B1b]